MKRTKKPSIGISVIAQIVLCISMLTFAAVSLNFYAAVIIISLLALFISPSSCMDRIKAFMRSLRIKLTAKKPDSPLHSHSSFLRKCL